MMPQLEVNSIHTSYGLSQVLFGISLSVEPGQVISLIGRNGVGKTTTMRSIIGLTPASSGNIVFEGTDITNLPAYKISRLGVGFVPEERRIFPQLSVWENLDIARRNSDKNDSWDEERVFALFPDLRDIQSRLGGVLSGGQQQMLTIARSLMNNPSILLLDEPSEGLAPKVVEDLRDQVKLLKDSGLSIVLAEQNLNFVLYLSDFCHILEKGEIKYSGSPEDLRKNPEIFERYLTL
jgi:branched-chain amino acid transport system ATP-binding protein